MLSSRIVQIPICHPDYTTKHRPCQISAWAVLVLELVLQRLHRGGIHPSCALSLCRCVLSYKLKFCVCILIFFSVFYRHFYSLLFFHNAHKQNFSIYSMFGDAVQRSYLDYHILHNPQLQHNFVQTYPLHAN